MDKEDPKLDEESLLARFEPASSSSWIRKILLVCINGNFRAGIPFLHEILALNFTKKN
jgi:hypothetical protein